MNLRKYIAASANHSHTLNRTATTVYRKIISFSPFTEGFSLFTILR